MGDKMTENDAKQPHGELTNWKKRDTKWARTTFLFVLHQFNHFSSKKNPRMLLSRPLQPQCRAKQLWRDTNWPQKHNTATKGMEICLKWDAKWFKTKWQQKGLKKRKITNSDYNKMQAKTQRKEKYVCTNWLIWILQTQNQLLTWATKPSQRPLSLKVSSRSHSGPHKMTMKEKKKKNSW